MGSLEEELKSGSPERVGEVQAALGLREQVWPGGYVSSILSCPHDEL